MGAIRSTEQGATQRATEDGGDLTREELESAERGFLQLLRRKRFSPAFRHRHAADLLAKARLELSEHLAEGATVRNPAGWIVHCAWRRTQNLLEQEGRAPRVLSIDNGHPIARESSTPEDRALESDRYRRLQSAIERLPEDERKVIALAYFEGMSVREVGRALKWDKCKADRRHHAALDRLRKLLKVEDIDALAVELGILAWASVRAPDSRPRLLAALDVAGHQAIALLGRTQDLARRLLGGGAAEPGMGPALGGAARAAGACGAAAVACLATGVIGPGVGAVNDLVEHHRHPPVHHHAPAPAPTEPASAPVAAPATSASAPPNEAAKRVSKSASHKRHREASSAASSAPTASPKQVAQEFDPFTGGGEATSEASSGSSGSASSSSSPSARRASSKQVESEFGF
jgi:RNA polymerase sigma factor (sigma-70 family)